MITPTHTLRRASLTAGIALALMAVLAAFAVFGAIAAQITPGDADKNRAGHRRVAGRVPTRHRRSDRSSSSST